MAVRTCYQLVVFVFPVGALQCTRYHRPALQMTTFKNAALKHEVDAKTALAWHMYFADPRIPLAPSRAPVTPRSPAVSSTSGSTGLACGEIQCDPARFAEEARSARPGIKSALAVLLGADFERQAAHCAEICGRDLLCFQSLLTQAGCDLNADDTYKVELLFAAATSKESQMAFSLYGRHRSQQSDIVALVNEDLRWRSSTLRNNGAGLCAPLQKTPRDVIKREVASRVKTSLGARHDLRAGGDGEDPHRPPPPAMGSSCKCSRAWPRWQAVDS